MSIWVRSQDKLCLMRIDALPIINHDEGERIWSIIDIGKFRYKLGTYESESRAIEVLYDIQEYMIKSSIAKVVDGEKEDFIVNPISIYEMPEE